MQDCLIVENTPARYHRENNVSGTTQSSIPAMFKTTQNKLDQKRQHDNAAVYIECICTYIYIYIYIYSSV